VGIFQIDSLTDSGDNRIDLFPEPSYVAREQATRSSHRTLGGVERNYTWSTWKAFTVPWRFVNSADAFRINQWWRDSDILGFTLNSSEDLKTVDCRIANDSQPISGMISPYNDLHEGVLMLEATDASSFKEKFFVLDAIGDSGSLAHLDQTYNSIR